MKNLPAGDNTMPAWPDQEAGKIRIRRPGGIDIGPSYIETLFTTGDDKKRGFVPRSFLIGAAILAGLTAPVKAQDAAAGEKDFVVCKACHQIGATARNAIGPVLNGIVGRKAGTYEGYSYSVANRDSGIVWTPEELDKYLTSPQAVVPKTKMIFPGLKDEQKRKNVIAYLEQFNEDGSRKN